MQRKQQVGECWVCVIFFACVCVWVRQIRRLRLTIPSPRALPCAPGAFLGGSQGGQVCPPLVTRSVRHRAVARGRRGLGQRPKYAQRSAPGVARSRGVRGNAPNFFFGRFLLFLADFAIFS
jgi:hypothetical protein